MLLRGCTILGRRSVELSRLVEYSQVPEWETVPNVALSLRRPCLEGDLTTPWQLLRSGVWSIETGNIVQGNIPILAASALPVFDRSTDIIHISWSLEHEPGPGHSDG